ncbi:MAG: DNA/RNA non-specific endonuclease [Bacteroidaceae bacterium]|nr:DNA/RNA non-specific endonuclease [Bacteroidaceae bacterium]
MKKLLILVILLLAIGAWSYIYKKEELKELGMAPLVETTDDVLDKASDYVDNTSDYVGALSDRVGTAAEQIAQRVESLKDEVASAKGKSASTTESSAQAAPASAGRKLELPGRMKRTPERIVEHTGFTLSFNREHNNPNWVAWELTAQEVSGSLQRNDDFDPDPELPANHQVTHADYTKSGYDRGHMVPAADMKWSRKAMNDCFYMSNICPQTHTLNAGGWETLESACRRWAKQEGAVYIVCGPVYKGAKHKTIGKDLKITVPEGFFKVVLSMREGKEKAIGFYYANSNAKQTMEQTATTVNEIEALTGMDFFVNINDKLEERIESTCSLKQWK